MKAVLYSRVSTERQANEGVSLDAQLAKTRAYAASHDLEIIGEFCDAGISGKSTKNRPEFLKALDMACREKATLVFYSLSRISRSTRDLMEIAERVKKSGAGLASIQEQIDTTTAMGNFLFAILSALCALERELISERTTGALAHMKASGRKTGGTVPYGFEQVFNSNGAQVLQVNEFEAGNVQAMKSLRAAGQSYGKIAGHLNTLAVPSKTGRPWSAKVVRDVLIAHSKRMTT